MSNKKAIGYLVILCVSQFPLVVQAQAIKGKLIDTDGATISNATLILQQMRDSSFVSVASSNQIGEFEITPSVIPYRLIIHHLAFDTKIITGEDYELGNVTLVEKSSLLKEVEIKADQPIMRVSDDGALVYDTKEIRKNNPVRNALDLFDDIPIIQKVGINYEIIGTGATTVILNGRRNNMSAEQLLRYLSTLPPEQVKSVEIFYNTPPQYGVKGASINVILDKQRSDKLQTKGDVHTTLSQRHNYSQDGGIDLSISKDRWSWNSSYTIDKSLRRYDLGLHSMHTIDSGTTYDIIQNTIQRNDNLSHSANSDFSFDFKNKDSFSLLYTGQFKHNKNIALSDLNIVNKRQIDSRNSIDGNNALHSASAEYVHNLWNVGIDYMFYKQGSNQTLDDMTLDSDEDGLYSNSKQKVNKWIFYMNNSLKLRKGQLSYGVDASISYTDNGHNVESNEEFYDDDRSFQTCQKEKSISAYFGYNQRIRNRGMFKVDLKGEYFKSEIEMEGQKSTLWNDFQLFPSLSFVYRPRLDRTLQITFFSTKTYPSYWKTNTSKIYMNPYCMTEGNPLLKPYETYQLNANYIIKSKYIIGLFCDVSPHYSTQLMHQDSYRLQAIYQYINLDYSGKAGFLGVMPIRWSNSINTSLTTTVFAIKQKGRLDNIHFNRGTISGRINVANNFILNRYRTLSFQLSGWYQLPTIQGIYNVKNMFNTSAALAWQSPKGEWNVTLKSEDIFDFYRMRTIAEGYSQHYFFSNKVDSQLISLMVRYVFNGYKEKKEKEVDTLRLGF